MAVNSLKDERMGGKDERAKSSGRRKWKDREEEEVKNVRIRNE